jgi:hypothetical protein
LRRRVPAATGGRGWQRAFFSFKFTNGFLVLLLHWYSRMLANVELTRAA